MLVIMSPHQGHASTDKSEAWREYTFIIYYFCRNKFCKKKLIINIG